MHLLELPAELRNRVYEYVLTDPTASRLHYQELTFGEPGAITFTLDGKPFNTLKQTCRLLHHDTAGLEAQFNTLIFKQHDPTDFLPTELFKRFTSRCPDTQLSTVILQPADDIKSQDYEHLIALAQWCKQHPIVTVKYLMPDFCLPDPTNYAQEISPWHDLNDACEQLLSAFLFKGIDYYIALHGHSTWRMEEWIDLMGLDVEDLERQALRWRGDCRAEDLEVGNLKFVPEVQMSGDQRLGALTELVENSEMSQEAAEVMDGWVEEGL